VHAYVPTGEEEIRELPTVAAALAALSDAGWEAFAVSEASWYFKRARRDAA
jgi:hypothetical protein